MTMTNSPSEMASPAPHGGRSTDRYVGYVGYTERDGEAGAIGGAFAQPWTAVTPSEMARPAPSMGWSWRHEQGCEPSDRKVGPADSTPTCRIREC